MLQSVVEKKLKREQKLSKFDLGREKFIERVWEWKNQSVYPYAIADKTLIMFDLQVRCAHLRAAQGSRGLL